jgi:hypothetical protein
MRECARKSWSAIVGDVNIAAQRAIYKFITLSHEVVLEMIAAQS